mgnify:CR=1 FL=1
MKTETTTMHTINIVSRWDSSRVLFTFQATDEQQASGLALRHALEAATVAHANLRGADLSGAYLSGAYLSDADLSDDMLAWKVRAALRQGQWPAVLEATRAMSEDSRADPAWSYWRARALLAGIPPAQRALLEAGTTTDAGAAPPRHKAEYQEARQLLESIASPRGFYEQLAMEEIGQRIPLPPKPAAPTAAEKEAARQNAGLARALYAIRIGLRPEGVREWNYSTNLAKPGGMTDRELLAAAQFATLEQCPFLEVLGHGVEIGDRADPVAERLAGRQHVLQIGVMVESRLAHIDGQHLARSERALLQHRHFVGRHHAGL